MKRAVAISFLSLFLFNVGGYYIVYWGLQSKAKSDLLHRLDAENYSARDVIVISIPISLPYPLQHQEFERVDGEFELNGEYYRLVKQRLENDTLFMVCIKDRHKKELVKVLDEYSNYANNLPASSNRALDLLSKLFKEFTYSAQPYISMSIGWSALISYGEKHLTLSERPQSVNSPPPRG